MREIGPPGSGSKETAHALGNRPVSVIHANTARDFQRIYDAGVEAGNESEVDRAQFREIIEFWKSTSLLRAKEVLSISSVHRLRNTLNSGHNVQLLEPDLIVEEIKWVLSHLGKGPVKSD